MKKSLRILPVLSLVLLMSVLTACTGPAKEDPKPDTPAETGTNEPGVAEDYELPISGVGPAVTTTVKANKRYVLSAITKNSVNPYMVKNLEGTAKAAADMGCDIVTLSPTKQDSVEEQVTIMEAMISKGVDGMVIHPSDSAGIMPGVRKAKEEGILISTIGTPAAEKTFLRTGVDYKLTGKMIAERLAEELDGKGKVIVLEGAPGAQNGQERLEGIKEGFSAFPDIEIVASQTANWSRVEGMSITENLLQRFPDIDAIIGSNDEMAIGAVQALKAAGLKDVLVAGFDANKDASEAIKNGEMLVSYNTDPFGSAYLAAVYMVMYLNDGTMPPADFVPFPSAEQNPMIDASNIDEYMSTDAWWIE